MLDPAAVAGLACPAGPLADRAQQLGVRWLPIHGTTASLRVHPRHTSVALSELSRMGIDLHRAAKTADADVLHANSVRAALAGLVARRTARVPLVVHVRDCLPDNRATRVIRSAVSHEADGIVAISHFVAARFMLGQRPRGRPRNRIDVIDNPVDLQRFSPPPPGRAPGSHNPVLAIVGQISEWKGHETAVRALAPVRQRFPDARLLVVGEVKFDSPSSRFDNDAFVTRLHTLIKTLGLTPAVQFTGERDDVPELMAAASAVLVPSVDEPFGRTVAEAMTIGTPVIASNCGGPSELIEDGVTGTLVPAGDPVRWNEAIVEVLEHPARAAERAHRARAVAVIRFSPERHVIKVTGVHERAHASYLTRGDPAPLLA